MDKIMRTDPKQSDENREEAGLEEALKLWMEIRQVDRKKGWERLEAEIGRQFGLLSVAGCCRYFMLRDRRAALASIGTKASNRAISRLG
ncbi:MAG: hypothetical protein BHV82_11515 [Odoribacter sp. 43_10]|nr:MAG: hypothetical protein BHV82_11515 [Odoribacter sp. 43_10]